MRPRLPARVVVAILGSAALAAETPVDRGLVERVTVRLVQLNFLAVDDDGRPVRDLRPAEIELRVGGEVKPLAFLQAYSPTPPPPPDAAAPGASAIEPAAPGTEAPPTRPRRIVFFFDHVNASARTRLRSLEAAREFLRRNLRPDDRVAIVAYDTRLRIVQNFTPDLRRLTASLEALEAETPRAAAERARAMDLLLDELEACRNPIPEIAERCATRVVTSYEEERFRELDAFTAAVRWVLYAIAPIPDVKSVVLFSEGVSRVPSRDGADAADAVLGTSSARVLGPRSRFEVEEKFDSIAEAAALAKAAVFTINPGGASRMTSISAARVSLPGGTANALQIDPWRSAERNAQQSLHEISWRTGGTATQGADILAAIERVDALASALYTIGYYAREDEDPSRKVKIRILRKDVKAEFQRDIPPPPADRAPLEAELDAAAGGCDARGQRVVALKLRVARRSLAFTRLSGNMTANFSLLVRVTPLGEALPAYEDFRTLNLTNPVRDHQSGRIPDPAIEQRIPLHCGAYSVAVTVSDAGSGAQRELSATLPE